MQKLKINLFGEWWVLMKLELSPIEQEYFTQIANRLQLPLYQAFLDPFFYHHLRLNSIPNLDKLPCKKVGGLLGTTNHQVEVWIDGKKSQKIFQTNHFSIDNLAFSLLQTNHQLLLEAISYPNCYVNFKKKETLINYQYSYLVDDLKN